MDNLARPKDLEDKERQSKNFFLNGQIGETIPLLTEMAEAGKVQAHYILATIYHEGLDVEKNPDAARELLKENIRVGDICSTFFGKRLGLTDVDLPLDALKELADNGNVFAQYEAAQYYFDEDNETALKYLKQAADIYGLAMRQLGDIYWEGGYGVEQNRAVAADRYEQAYDKGVFSDKSINRIGMWYSDFFSINGIYSEALKWWRIGEEKNYPCCIANLGWAYRWGRGVDKNYSTAVDYFNRAIEAGENAGFSERNIAEMILDKVNPLLLKTFINPIFGPIDYYLSKLQTKAEAKKWYEKAAAKGDKQATKWLKANS